VRNQITGERLASSTTTGANADAFKAVLELISSASAPRLVIGVAAGHRGMPPVSAGRRTAQAGYARI
jgi:hypothetical protein